MSLKMKMNTAFWIAIIVIQFKHTIAINNRARSTLPPSTIALDEIPMFLTITFDDALHTESYTKTQQIINHKNRNSEQIPLIYYISNEFSDYKLIQDHYLQGCEIATHTVTHTTHTDSTISKCYHEINHSRELISTHSDIPTNQINGFRAPFLEASDNMFKVLNGLTPQYLYDSSVVNALNENNLFDWPYTYDIYEPDFVVSVGEGPKKSYEGLWEIPMYTLYSDITNKQQFNSMDYIGDYDILLNSFKNNFEHRLNTNKAPMGLYFHAAWLYIDSHVNALNDFIEWILQMDNTWIVTNKQLIDWINNPIPKSQYTVVNSNTLMNDKTDFITCYYDGIFHSVLSECPEVDPHVFEWDESELVYSEISIETTDDNILNIETDICENDSYEIYDYNTIYCADSKYKNIVRYNDVLYQCKWWTQGVEPSIDSAWEMVKNCITVTHSFVKGNIEPYGAVDVFLDSVLTINIQPIGNGYVIDGISVIINEHYYPIEQIFDNYNVNNNQLTITFNEIKLPQYQIEISFKDI